MRVVGALVLLLLAAAPARADTFGELPFRPVAGVATCLRATGVPGELARWTQDGVELLRADASGLVVTERVRLGPVLVCPEVAAQANGAAIAAVLVKDGVRVALREPGGRFGAPVTLSLPASAEDNGFAVAVSPRGDAVVAGLVTEAARARVLAYRRLPQTEFGVAEQVAEWRGRGGEDGLAAGIDAAGRATLAWTRPSTSIDSTVETASAAPAAAFGVPSSLGASTLDTVPALAVAPDGRALIAFGGEATTVAEREPAAGSFGAPVTLPGAGTFSGVALALAADGAAAVSWRPANLHTSNGVRVATRAAPGPFGAPREVAPGHGRPSPGLESFVFSSDGPPQDAPRLAAAVAGADVVLAWEDNGAQSAAAGLAGGPIRRTALGGPVRPTVSLAPLGLADGRAAVAWADDAAEFATFPTGQGRVHLALAGAPRTPNAPPPAVTVPRLERRSRSVDDPIVVPVRCSGACDVRAAVERTRYAAVTIASRASAGPLTLRIRGFELLRRGMTHVDVRLRYGAPGSRTSATRRVRVPVRVRRSPPVPTPLDVRARRSGDDVIVTWRASFAAARAVFVALALDRHGEPVASRGLSARGRRTFRLTLRHAASARTVKVIASGNSDRRGHQKTVRVR